MVCPFAAFLAVFLQHEFLKGVEFVSAGDVVLPFAHGAGHCKLKSLILFRHR